VSTAPVLKPKELARYGRQIILPQLGKAGQQRLKDARVLVIGAGGLGMPLIQYLAAAGIGTLGLADGDEVQESNLHRQVLYQHPDIGRKKLKVLKDRVSKLNPHVQLQLHLEHLTEKNSAEIVAQYDIVADGTDTFEAKYLIDWVCQKLQKPLVFGSVLGFQGQVSVFHLKDKAGKPGPGYRTLFPEAPDNSPSCSEAGVLGILPGIIGSLMALEVLKIAGQFGTPLNGRLLSFDGLSHSFSTVSFGHEPQTEVRPGAGPEVAANPPLRPELFGARRSPEEADTPTPPPAQIDRPVEVRSITPRELEEWAAQERSFSLIDVRDAGEHDLVNIGGRLIPLGRLEASLGRFRKDVTYVVYCKNGTRSRLAARLLMQKGLEEVYNLEGGILRYREDVDPELLIY
ncbi:MAG: molybdopterin-synthase adenylyltransferase MoeB, partial [Sphingobacteriia bacterium]